MLCICSTNFDNLTHNSLNRGLFVGVMRFVSAFCNKTVVTTTSSSGGAKVVDRVKSDIRAYGGWLEINWRRRTRRDGDMLGGGV